MKRQERWLKKGYTREQIENHLSFERYKSKQARERATKNNLANKEIIAKVKSEILHKTFDNIYVLSVRPTTDGKGFWCKVHKTFKDGSEGDFRQFYHFDDYTLDNFKEYLYM